MLINEIKTQTPQPSASQQQAPSASSQAPSGSESIFSDPSQGMQTDGFEIPNDVIEGWKEQFPEIFGDDSKTNDLEKNAPEKDDDVKQKEENETEKFYDDMKKLTPDERDELLNSCPKEDRSALEEVFKYIDENM